MSGYLCTVARNFNSILIYKNQICVEIIERGGSALTAPGFLPAGESAHRGNRAKKYPSGIIICALRERERSETRARTHPFASVSQVPNGSLEAWQCSREYRGERSRLFGASSHKNPFLLLWTPLRYCPSVSLSLSPSSSLCLFLSPLHCCLPISVLHLCIVGSSFPTSHGNFPLFFFFPSLVSPFYPASSLELSWDSQALFIRFYSVQRTRS